jgi:uncharacterized protein (TIGR03083 family)
MIGSRTTRTAAFAPTERKHALQLLRAEVDAWSSLLATLSPEAWDAPTVCDRWSVRDIVGHLCGHAEEVGRPLRFAVRNRRGRSRHPDLGPLDSHMEIQVEEHRHLSTDELQDAYATAWARAFRRLARMPTLVRNFSVKTGIDAMPTLRLGELADIIYLRDHWMHRDDVCRAVGRPTAPQPYDEEVVGQVLRDLDRDFWSGPAVIVELSGCVTGPWRIGAGPIEATVQVDALHFMRLLAGRAREPDLRPVDGDPAAADALARVRVPF